MRKKIGGIFLLILLGMVVWGSHKLSHYVLKSMTFSVSQDHSDIKVVIDAGHGGRDGGKTGDNGEKESEINLKIARLVRDKLEEKNVKVYMTREDEQAMADGNAADLKARAEWINQKSPQLAVSIHQNSFTDPSVKGAQVFYHEKSQEGKAAAESLQKAFLSLDEGNTRQPKANATYYLLKKTEVPVIIAECGFLSSPEEAAKLMDSAYQEMVAEAICEGICKYFGITEN